MIPRGKSGNPKGRAIVEEKPLVPPEKAFTAQRKLKFLVSYRANCNVSAAARAAGINRRSVYQAREDDAEFARLMDEYKQEHLDAIEAEFYRRAVQGDKKPIMSMGKPLRDDERNIVTEVKYDTRAGEILLQAHRPEFRLRSHVELSGPGGRPIELVNARERSQSDCRTSR